MYRYLENDDLVFFSDRFLDGSPVRLRVMFSALGGVVRGVKAVSVGDMRVVCGFFVISLFVVFGGLTVVRSSMLVMVCRFFVVFCSFMVHRGSLFSRRRLRTNAHGLPI